jgi:hypothetical protein
MPEKNINNDGGKMNETRKPTEKRNNKREKILTSIVRSENEREEKETR